MKTLFNSLFTKLIVFGVCLVMIFCFVRDTGEMLNYGDIEILTEDKFSDSSFFREKCRDTTFAFNEAVDDIILKGDRSGLEGLDPNFVKYYININGDEYANYNDSIEKYWNLDLFWIYEKSDNNEEYTDNSNYGAYYSPEPYFLSSEYKPDSMKIYLGFSEDGFPVEKEQWQNEKDSVCTYLYNILIYGAVLLLSLIYFTLAAGRRGKDREVYTMFFDGIFGEIIIMLMAFIGIMGSVISGLLLIKGAYNTALTGFDIYLINLSVLAAELTFGAVLALWLSLVRSIKAKKFLRRFVVFRIISYVYRKLRLIVPKCLNIVPKCISAVEETVSSSIGRLVIAYLAIVSIAFALCVLLMFGTEMMVFYFLGFPVIFILAARFGAKYVKCFDEVRKGVAEIKSGNMGYKIPELKNKYFNDMAEDINSIGDGIAISVEKSVRSERLKSELITNVSHDLKTPLTSVINFSKLLCEQKLEPAEANDYAKIIYDKSIKLKNLTSDLFDISKVQSGNEVMNFEDIDLCLLVRQSMAEYEKAIEDSGLEFILALPEDGASISADGKKLSRVLGNLIDNTVKYAMKGTRVYLSVYKKEDETVFEMKNISAVRIGKTAEEITDRFVRGDESRSTEGSGLGLAIVKSYTEANNGKFRLTIDGDLFKVELKF